MSFLSINMFEALKKKLASWLGKPEKKEEKKAKKEKKISKKEKKGKKAKKEIEEVIEEKKEIEEAEEVTKEPIKEAREKKGFFTKLKEKFIKTEEEKEEEEVEEIIEEAEEEKPEEPKKEEPAEEIEEMLGEAEEEVEEVEEEKEEAPKENFFSKFFRKLSSAKITKENFNEIFQELEIILLENNVAIEVVEKIKEDLSKSLVGTQIKRTEIEQKITSALKDSILNILIEPESLLEKIKNKSDGPFVILFFGINGSGKTTSIAKLAHKLKKASLSVVIAAADTFRAASIEQLQTHGENIDVDVISDKYGADPASVAFEAIQHAKKNHIRVVLIDTAGRMYTKQNLMKEMEKIVRVSKPDLKIFVGESITGNDAVEQAKTFNETAGIDGIILSKADVDEKAGTILSVSYVTKRPIYYLGIGQDYDDLQDFKKSAVLEHLGLK